MNNTSIVCRRVNLIEHSGVHNLLVKFVLHIGKDNHFAQFVKVYE
jgi:hypothetical protein